jgi:hypothetical protein
MSLKIIEVSTEILRFLKETGEMITVNFNECNENWIAYQKRKNAWTEEEFEHFKNQSRCIGQRDVCAKPPYFEFFTRPFIRIGLRNQKEFSELQRKIQDVGWTTFDLS